MKTVLVANIKGGSGKTMIATNLSAALAMQGYSVILADADAQKSSLMWLKQRPEEAAPITAVNLQNLKKMPDEDRADFMVIDAPGGIEIDHFAELIVASDVLVVPTQISFFDIDSTRRFIKKIDDIKRIRKGKVPIYMVANRVRATQKKQTDENHIWMSDEIGREPFVYLSERIAYAQLAASGLSGFDYHLKKYRLTQDEWQPLLQAIIDLR